MKETKIIAEAYQQMYESKLQLSDILNWQDENYSFDGAIGFSRKAGENYDIEYTLRNDGWFRKTREPGLDYGLPIKGIKLKKFYETRTNFETYLCSITFLPTSEDFDNKKAYDKMDMILWVHKDFDVKAVIKFVESNMDNWVPFNKKDFDSKYFTKFAESNMDKQVSFNKKDFTIMTTKQMINAAEKGIINIFSIKEVGRIAYSGGKNVNKFYLNKCLKKGEVTSENVEEFAKAFKKKALKLIENDEMRDAAISLLKGYVKANDINDREIDNSVLNWIYDILRDKKKCTVFDILVIDGYKLYQYVTVEKESNSTITDNGARIENDVFKAR